MSKATKKSTARKGRKKPARDPHQVVTDAILQKLREGVVPWRQPWASTGGTPVNLSTGREYRGINILSLMLAGYGDRHWLTFNQARELGGSVRAGETAAPIVRWLETTKRLTPAQARAAAGRGEQVRYDQDGPYTRRVGMRLFWGFNVLQTEGLERPGVPPVDWDPIVRAEEVLRGFARGPRLIEGGDVAQYRGGPDVVYVPDRGRFEDGAFYYHAAFHELTHSTGHASRLGRDMSGEFGSAAYAKEELVAELGAAMLCAGCGLNVPPEFPASYLANWLSALENDERLVIGAAQAAQKAVDLILTREES